MYKVQITQTASKELEKIYKSSLKDAQRIVTFLVDILPNVENPFKLSNVKKVQGYANCYRYRIGIYRVIVLKNDEKLSILVIKIAKKDDKTYKNLKAF